MTEQSAASNQASLDTVQSILRELIEFMNEISHAKDELIAKGVPASTIDDLLALMRQGESDDYDSLRDRALDTASKKLGGSAISKDALEEHISNLVALYDDLAEVRLLSRTFELNTYAINMLTQVIRLNPGDNGLKVLNKMMEYARAYGVPVGGVQLVPGTGESSKPKSVLPDIQLPEPGTGLLVRYRALAIELGLGVLVTVTALVLLT